ncbi:hypothetical protein BpHYR1_005459 [Brachionus plicatilis]|uniref:Uncharacterized protein n=1 Tax=Brachionus plicatilis TaxID=10195 RepID=A0A3M7S2V0_BRAPC|nr:hypothetical protein BpHYR1_005459 [Brachionus plicatilis]
MFLNRQFEYIQIILTELVLLVLTTYASSHRYISVSVGCDQSKPVHFTEGFLQSFDRSTKRSDSLTVTKLSFGRKSFLQEAVGSQTTNAIFCIFLKIKQKIKIFSLYSFLEFCLINLPFIRQNSLVLHFRISFFLMTWKNRRRLSVIEPNF